MPASPEAPIAELAGLEDAYGRLERWRFPYAGNPTALDDQDADRYQGEPQPPTARHAAALTGAAGAACGAADRLLVSRHAAPLRIHGDRDTMPHPTTWAGGSSPWQERDVAILISTATAEAMWEHARLGDVDQGGRFAARSATVLLHARRRPRPSIPVVSGLWAALILSATADPVIGSFSARFHTPTHDQATIYRLAWDPTRGGSEVAVRQAIEELVSGVQDFTVWRPMREPAAPT